MTTELHITQPVTQEPQPVTNNLLDYAMQIAHERELHGLGHKHDSEKAVELFNAACRRGFARPQPVTQPLTVEDYKAKYFELIYAVSSKCPGESRHETALHYIRKGGRGSRRLLQKQPTAPLRLEINMTTKPVFN